MGIPDTPEQKELTGFLHLLKKRRHTEDFKGIPVILVKLIPVQQAREAIQVTPIMDILALQGQQDLTGCLHMMKNGQHTEGILVLRDILDPLTQVPQGLLVSLGNQIMGIQVSQGQQELIGFLLLMRKQRHTEALPDIQGILEKLILAQLAQPASKGTLIMDIQVSQVRQGLVEL